MSDELCFTSLDEGLVVRYRLQGGQESLHVAELVERLDRVPGAQTKGLNRGSLVSGEDLPPVRFEQRLEGADLGLVGLQVGLVQAWSPG